MIDAVFCVFVLFFFFHLETNMSLCVFLLLFRVVANFVLLNLVVHVTIGF
jgi:hypothetical protein